MPAEDERADDHVKVAVRVRPMIPKEKLEQQSLCLKVHPAERQLVGFNPPLVISAQSFSARIDRWVFYFFNRLTGLRNTPMRSNSTSTTSPSFIQRSHSRLQQPAMVPLPKNSPTCRVSHSEM